MGQRIADARSHLNAPVGRVATVESLEEQNPGTATGTTVVRFSFGKFKELSSAGKQDVYATDVTAESLWDKKISRAQFMHYVFDKAKVRIGEGWISISDVSPSGG